MYDNQVKITGHRAKSKENQIIKQQFTSSLVAYSLKHIHENPGRWDRRRVVDIQSFRSRWIRTQPVLLASTLLILVAVVPMEAEVFKVSRPGLPKVFKDPGPDHIDPEGCAETKAEYSPQNGLDASFPLLKQKDWWQFCLWSDIPPYLFFFIPEDHSTNSDATKEPKSMGDNRYLWGRTDGNTW